MEPFELACLILDRSALSGDELVGAASDDERDFLDRYELLEKAGSGVSGEVFRARDRSLERIVAVKRIPCSPALGKTREAAARLRRELLALVTLAHEGIPSIYDAKWTARYVYVVMEFVAGTSLARALEERRLSLAERVAVVEEVARIVHFAHERGFVHRDLKPSNILLGSDGRPRVVDFGVAKNVDDDARLTSTGAFLGTVQFMSPEQASGRSKDVDARSDVFSLGAILFAALAGRPPFEGASAFEVAIATTEKTAPLLRSIDPAIPARLEGIAARALEKDPRARHPSAFALAADLRAWRLDAARASRRSRALVVLALAATAIGVGIVCAELAPVPRPESVRVEHVAASSSPTRPAAPPVPDEPAPLGDPAPKEAVPVTPPVPSEPPPVKARPAESAPAPVPAAPLDLEAAIAAIDSWEADPPLSSRELDERPLAEVVARISSGMATLARGERPRARLALGRASRLLGRNESAITTLGLALVEARRPPPVAYAQELALACWDKLLAERSAGLHDPVIAGMHQTRSAFSRVRGTTDLERARLAWLSDALLVSGHDSSLLGVRADALLERDPGSRALVRGVLGDVLLYEGDIEGALSAYDDATRAQPRSLRALTGTCIALARLASSASASTAARRRAIERSPDALAAVFTLAPRRFEGRLGAAWTALAMSSHPDGLEPVSLSRKGRKLTLVLLRGAGVEARLELESP